jgi:cytidylate kinase
MKYTSIAISGQIAAGTTTAGRNVSKVLGLKFESAGDFFRKYALDHNIPLHEKSKIPDELDQEVDHELTVLAEKGGIVIDAHYIGYFTKDLPHVLKVLLTCDYEIRIKRALDRVHTHAETEEEIRLREEGLDQKFRKLYAPQENYLDPRFFDLVIDTTNTTQEEVAEKIINKFKSG